VFGSVPPRTFKSAPKSLIAMNLETTEEELIHAVFPHPTLSEMMHESVLDAYGRVIHV
jgi:dihydrolipoamide dehydrogenase